ncbi:MAG: Ig-like domain-containing protein [Bacteroidales bacterium]|nr:Ig-like domain-containing protein [Bacteroidales bacterium]
MMKEKLLLWVLLLSVSVSIVDAQTTDFTGHKIFINPGHGGYDSDDRHILATDFWESEGNLVKGLFLRELLENLNATVYMSRTTNTTDDDLPLSVIDEMANSANVDFFLSIHSNGWDGKQNQPLMLFRGYDDQPVFADAKSMAEIIWQKIYEKGNCWTSSSQYVKGDWTFYPQWGDKVGLGVLRTLTMPGVLSEGSFHDYIPESWRLRNTDFLHHEAWAFLRSFIEFYDITPVNQGVIVGVVRDSLKTPSWYFKAGTPDEKQALNGVKVTLIPGNKIYNVDTLNNGFFFFDSLSPGEYKLYFDALDEYYRDSLLVTVTANQTSISDMYLQYDTTLVPELLSLSPDLADSIPSNQEFTFTFSMPMNPDSVQKAIQFDPEAVYSYTWDDDYKVLKVEPTVGLSSKTDYTIKVTTTACSKWNVKMDSEQQFSFVTFYRPHLIIERTYPSEGLTEVTLYPQIRVYFDAPIDESLASSEIRLLNDQDQELTKLREKFIIESGKGAYYFETDQALDLNKQYTLSIGSGIADETGITLGEDADISFTTRSKEYNTGNLVEPYEVISNFWDPETSGSTAGTINELTTFTASSDVKYSGSYSGELNYVFSGTSGGVCRVFNTKKPSIGSNESSVFGIWVFGDLSYNILEYWFYSPGTTNQIAYVDTIDWAGWDFKTIPFNSIPGSGEMLFHSTVIRQADIGTTNGTVWFDDATVFVPTGIEDQYAESLDIMFYPNPTTGNGIVRFTLAESSHVRVSLYSLDGKKVEDLCNVNLNAGLQEIPWTPTSVIPNGVYLIRTEIRPLRNDSPVTLTGRWVLAR